MADQTAWPLCWPAGWPRTKFPQRSRFGTYTNKPSVHKAREFLGAELDRLGARNVVLSTNMELRLDGQPRSDRREPVDAGAAVYFQLNGKPVAIPCDKWNTVGDNIYAIGKHIEALRGQERWGCGNVERAFTGYLALNEKTEPSCWDTLEIDKAALDVLTTGKEALIITQFRRLALQSHPDHGGSVEAFDRLNRAKDIALASIKR